MVGLWILPLAFAVAVVAPLVVERFSGAVRLQVSQVGLALFGDYVGEDGPRRRRQRSKLRAAHVDTPHRVYASRTLLYSLVTGVSGSVLGVYAAATLLWTLRIGGEAIRAGLPARLDFLADLTRVTRLGGGDLFVLLLVSSATVGATLAVGTYLLRWELLDQRARSRATEIEATLPRTIAFIYALSRSGMSFPAILDALTRNRGVYGEAAVEVGVAVRDMNAFGTDVLTALNRMAERTPSENLDEFGDNLSSVLGSGQSLSGFLREQYDRYREEAEAQQAQYLELLSTFAEAYVTLLVAGPLFFITILVVIGLVMENTLRLLRIVVYLGVPLASLAFVVYVDSVTETLADAPTTTDRSDDFDAVGPGDVADVSDAGDAVRAPEGPVAKGGRATGGLTDGGAVVDDPVGTDGWAVGRERLDAYDRFERTTAALRRPGLTLLRNPEMTFLLTVPVSCCWIALRVGAVPLSPMAALRTLDAPVVEALLFCLVAFAGVHELDKRRIRAVERVVPDFLDRLASVNDAGASVVASIERLSRADMGRLTPELERTWRDVRWGATVQTALRRLDRRVQSPMVTRATTLAANAMNVSGDIGPVLEIAADEARSTRRLRRERAQEMLTYLLVIYISFAVFLAIIAALSVSFIPAIEATAVEGAGGRLPEGFSTGVFAGIHDVDTAAYELIFFHTAVLQAVCSGLVAGQLGEGRLADGAKHAAFLLVVTMGTFVVL